MSVIPRISFLLLVVAVSPNLTFCILQWTVKWGVSKSNCEKAVTTNLDSVLSKIVRYNN
jgi:hypothetical protein